MKLINESVQHVLEEMGINEQITFLEVDVGGSPNKNDKAVANAAKVFLNAQPHMSEWADEAEYFSIANHPEKGIIGSCAVVFASDTGEVGYAVDPAFQRRGIAMRLLKMAEAFLVRVNHQYAGARASSPESVQLLKKAGYTTSDTEMHNSWWEKELK